MQETSDKRNGSRFERDQAEQIIWFTFISIFHQLLLMKKEKVVVGKISEYSAAVLPMGKMQPIVFLTMLAPSLQNVLMVSVFWRRNTRPTTNPYISHYLCDWADLRGGLFAFFADVVRRGVWRRESA
jgi:hypothetical protein